MAIILSPGKCEKCGKKSVDTLIGYKYNGGSVWLCRRCALKYYQRGQKRRRFPASAHDVAQAMIDVGIGLCLAAIVIMLYTIADRLELVMRFLAPLFFRVGPGSGGCGSA